MLPYSMHYVNPSQLPDLPYEQNDSKTLPQNINEQSEESEEEQILKEEYFISQKDGGIESESSSSQGKLESFPNQSEGVCESIFHKNPFQDDNFNHAREP